MPRREDHEVHKDMWGHWRRKKSKGGSKHYATVLKNGILKC